MRHELCGCAALWALTACHYDLSGVYQDDAGVDQDPVRVEDAGRLGALIDLWSSHAGVDDECRACARQRCAEQEEACRADALCVAYTTCVAASPHPAGIADCRARYPSWVGSGDVRARDLTGPYGQCVFGDQCAIQCDGNADLACVGGYAFPRTMEGSVPLHLFLNDARVQSEFVPGISVKVCYAGDLACASPFASGVTDERGLVDLNLPTSFNRAFSGYLQLEKEGVYPTLLKFGWNIATESTLVVSIVNKDLFEFVVSLAGVAVDPTRGMLQTRMFGCQGVGVRGVRFEVDAPEPELRRWYVSESVPRFDVLETNAVGSGGIVNLPVGFRFTSAVRVADGLPVARTEAPLRAGFMTVVVFAPLPIE